MEIQAENLGWFSQGKSGENSAEKTTEKSTENPTPRIYRPSLQNHEEFQIPKQLLLP